MFRLAVNGAEMSVSNVVQAFAPAGLRWNTTWTVVSPAVVVRLSVPDVFAPGSLIAIDGAWLSIVTARAGVVVWLPATSVTTTWSSAEPFAQPIVFRVVA